MTEKAHTVNNTLYYKSFTRLLDELNCLTAK